MDKTEGGFEKKRPSSKPRTTRVDNITPAFRETWSEVLKRIEISEGKGTKNRSCYDG